MKKIVDNLLYDTDKAEEICSRHGEGGITEVLFRTKKENWFLVYSQYSSNDDYGSSYVQKQDLVPMTVREVLDWLKKHEFIDELIEYFPEELEEA